MRRSRPTAQPALLLAVLYLLAAGCGSDRTSGLHQGANQPPSVSLSPEPIESDELAYNARFTWSASDPDGFITRFEYAMDPPAEFTETEIAEGGPGIVTDVLPGENGAPGVTRVSKTVDGETVSFTWTHTREFSRRFTFSATEPDVEPSPEGPVPTGRFRGMHALYVRAVDDDGAVSAPEKAAFTATTVAPTSRLLRPADEIDAIVGPEVTFRWTGEDPDGDFKGSGGHFLYKLVDVSHVSFQDRHERASELLLDDPGPWLTTSEVSKSLLMGCCGYAYLMGVRAVDAAGAREPFLDLGRNAVALTVYRGLHPTLTIRSQIFGTTVFGTTIGTSTLPLAELSMAANGEITFSWSASTEDYYGRIWGYSWGFDLVDPEAGGPASGWSSWSDITTTGPIVMSRQGLHTLYVRARDAGGGTTLGTFRVHVVDFQPDQDVLYVDDSYDNQFPTDTEHDAFWRARLLNYGAEFGEFHAHGDLDRSSLSPRVPTLSELSRYRMLVWENFGSGYNGETALVHDAAILPTLRSYLLSGGQMWLDGRMNVPPCLDSPNGIRSDLTYPIGEDRMVSGTFAYDFLKLRGGVDNPRGFDPDDFMIGVAPHPGGPAPYDSMDADLTKLRYPFQPAIPFVDALLDFPEDLPGFRGDLERIYAYRSYGAEVLGRESDLHGGLVAVRWHDPDPQPLHGRIQWFGFPLYYMVNDQAQETFNRSLDWFREEDNTGP